MKSSRKPHPKVAAGGVGGAFAFALVWTLGQFGVEMPPEVAAAFAVLVGTGAGYMKACA